MWRFWAVLLLALTASLPAAAHGHGHGGSRLFLGFNFAPVPYYYGPPAYYYPPPVYYAPPPAYYYPPAAYVVPAAPPANCRTYRGDATVDGSGQPFFGTACLQADGRWHIVN